MKDLESIIQFNKQNIILGLSPKGYGRACFAKRSFESGDIVVKGFGRIISHQTSKISIQIDHDRHFQPTKWTGRYWNHSCDPNTHIKADEDGFPLLVALKNISANEEITYFYAMTEHSWGKSAEEAIIDCLCRSDNCKGKILAFSQLSKVEQVQLVKNGHCIDYLKNKI